MVGTDLTLLQAGNYHRPCIEVVLTDTIGGMGALELMYKIENERALSGMEQAVARLAGLVPPPTKVEVDGEQQFRYFEKEITQAIVQKLAGMVSALSAAEILHLHGHVGEQAMLHRVIGELHDDLFFLMIAEFDSLSDLHKCYLNNFFQETFDSGDSRSHTQKPRPVSRKEMRTCVVEWIESHKNTKLPDDVRQASQKLFNMHSRYIHSNSPEIMIQYGGNPPKFHMRGWKGSLGRPDFNYVLRSYYYRSLAALYLASEKLGDYELCKQVEQMKNRYEKYI